MTSNNYRPIILTSAFALYVAFCFVMFPSLQVTVMIYSVPLTMLGGWYFSYLGANTTTLLTIVFHYILLNLYSDDPSVIREAFNPFGIGTQMVLANASALLKCSRDRYNHLNESLEIKVAERTSELENLANYLFFEQQKETTALTASLLKEPYESLQCTLKISNRLMKELEVAQHPNLKTAEQIHQIVLDCIDQLHGIENHTLTSDKKLNNLKSAVEAFVDKIEQISNIDIRFVGGTEWDNLPDEDGSLYGIITEAITNALKHAMPSYIELGALKESSQTIVYIENDGRPYAKDKSEGMGMPMMRYRAKKIRASLSIEAISNGKTRIECRIPDAKKIG